MVHFEKTVVSAMDKIHLWNWNVDIYCNCVSEEKDKQYVSKTTITWMTPHSISVFAETTTLRSCTECSNESCRTPETVLLLLLIQLSPVKYLANIKHCEDHTRSTSTHKVLQHRSSEWLFGPRTSHWWCMFLVYCATLYSPSYVCLLSYMYLSFPFCEK